MKTILAFFIGAAIVGSALCGDCNLVQGQAYRTPFTCDLVDGGQVVFANGDLVIINSSGDTVFTSGTNGEAATLIFRNDGNLVLLNDNDQIIFSRATNPDGASVTFTGTNIIVRNNAGGVIDSALAFP